MPSTLYGCRYTSLVFGTSTTFTSRFNFRLVRYKPSKSRDIFIVYICYMVHTKLAHFTPREVFGSASPWWPPSPTIRIIPHAHYQNSLLISLGRYNITRVTLPLQRFALERHRFALERHRFALERPHFQMCLQVWHDQETSPHLPRFHS